MSESEPSLATGPSFMDMTAGVVSAYVANNSVPVAELPALIAGIHAAMAGLGQGGAVEPTAVEKPTPAQIRKSITHDALTSFVDGKSYKTLKRHLTTHGMTMDQYRERFGLPRDYPSTAASYSATRSALAKGLGLGRKRSTQAVEPASPVVESAVDGPAAPKRRGRAPKAKAEA